MIVLAPVIVSYFGKKYIIVLLMSFKKTIINFIFSIICLRVLSLCRKDFSKNLVNAFEVFPLAKVQKSCKINKIWIIETSLFDLL